MTTYNTHMAHPFEWKKGVRFYKRLKAKIAARSERFDRIINGHPTLLFSHGKFIPRALRKERVTEGEVRAAIREMGVTRVEDVDAVVLENDGSLSVSWESKRPGETSLVDAHAPDGERAKKRSS